MSGSNNSEESEDTIDQYLQDHGLLEEGMTSGDKRNLWEVIKLSKDTAQAEEQDRQKRARHNLQFDEVSSRSDDSAKEEEKIPIIVTVSSCPRSSSQDSPHQNTAAVLPFSYSPTSTSVSSSSRAVVAPVSPSPSQQSQSLDSCNRDLPKQIIDLTEQRSLRSKLNESFNVLKDNREVSPIPEDAPSISSEQSTPSSRNLKNTLSPRKVQNVPSPEQIQNPSSSRNANVLSPRNNQDVPSPATIQNPPSPEKEHEYHSISQNDQREASPRRWSEVVTGNSKPNLPSTFSSMDLPQNESPTTSDHESSPVSRIRKDFKFSLKFSQYEENNEECCALNDKEKSETVPSPVNEPPSNESTNLDEEGKKETDRERNIDAFNCDRSNYELALKVRKPRKMCSRLPFYIPPRKMDVHSYIAYFKKCVSDHAAKLLEIQKKSHKCIPWGDPVTVGEINSNSYSSADQKNSIPALQRYNFRDRRMASQKVDTIYEDTNSQSEIKQQEEDNDDFFDSLLDDKSSDGIQVTKKEEPTDDPKSNSATPERQGSKRKSESSDEMEEKRSTSNTWLSSVKTEEEEVASKRKKLGPVCYAGATKSWKDLDIDIVSDEECASKGPLQKVKRKRVQRKLYKPLITKKEAVDEEETEIFAEITDEGASSAAKSHHEVDIIRPAPVKLRRNGRRRVQQTMQHQQNQQNEADVTVVFEASNSSTSKKGQEMKVPCPICRISYPVEDIEAHASECIEYCAEGIPEDEERSSSPQVPSQDCWSQYDGVHEGNTQDNLHNVLDGRMSPIRCFVPISAQSETQIDYHNQFRIARTLRRPSLTRAVGRGRKRKRKVKRKRKKATGVVNKKMKIDTNISYFVNKLKDL